eukprot:CFRG3005T1
MAPKVASPGVETVCESDLQLLTLTSSDSSCAPDESARLLRLDPQRHRLSYPKLKFMPHKPPMSLTSAVAEPRTVVEQIKSSVGSILDSLLVPSLDKIPTETNGILKAASWHPERHTLAVAYACENRSLPDAIRISHVSTESPGCELSNDSHQETLKENLLHPFQIDVKCVAWQPNSGDRLAVGCRYGILIWRVNLACADFLSDKRLGPITDIAYSPDGRKLAACSAASRFLAVWDVATGAQTVFYRYALSGISVLKWSPTGNVLFTANIEGGFRLWNTRTWESRSWATPSTLTSSHRDTGHQRKPPPTQSPFRRSANSTNQSQTHAHEWDGTQSQEHIHTPTQTRTQSHRNPYSPSQAKSSIDTYTDTNAGYSSPQKQRYISTLATPSGARKRTHDSLHDDEFSSATRQPNYSSVTCAQWSSDGKTLVFALSGEALLHMVALQGNKEDIEQATYSVYTDILQLHPPPPDDPHADEYHDKVSSLGIRAIAWDDSNHRLAVALNGSRHVALFATRKSGIAYCGQSNTVRMDHLGYITKAWDLHKARPKFLQFSCMEGNRGSLLAVGWECAEEEVATTVFTPLFF